MWNKIKLEINNITENSFVINATPSFENEYYPESYKISIYANSPVGENFNYQFIENAQLPYTFVNPLATGIEYDIFLEAKFPPESFNEYDMQRATVKTKFLPITALDFPIIIPTPEGSINSDTLKIYIPTFKDAMFGEFSNSKAVITPNNATNSNLDGGSREFCNRLIEDTSIAETDGNGYVRGKKRGVTRMKFWKYDANDKFDVFYKNIEVIQEVTGLTVSNKQITLKVGDTETINANVLPNDANDKRLKFVSDNDAISVNEKTGLVTALRVTAEGEVATVICSPLDKPLIKEYISVRVVSADEDIWTDIQETGKYFNASDFNKLAGNTEYINKIVSKVPFFPPLPSSINKVSEITGFLTTGIEIKNLFGNINHIYDYITGNNSINVGDYAPDREYINTAISKLNELKNVDMKNNGITVQLKDENDNNVQLENVHFGTLVNRKNASEQYYHIYTDKNGAIVFNGLPRGKYKIQYNIYDTVLKENNYIPVGNPSIGWNETTAGTWWFPEGENYINIDVDNKSPKEYTFYVRKKV